MFSLKGYVYMLLGGIWTVCIYMQTNILSIQQCCLRAPSNRTKHRICNWDVPFSCYLTPKTFECTKQATTHCMDIYLSHGVIAACFMSVAAPRSHNTILQLHLCSVIVLLIHVVCCDDANIWQYRCGALRVVCGWLESC